MQNIITVPSDDIACIYNMQAIREQLTVSEFEAALSDFEIISTFNGRFGGIVCMELKASDDRFAGSYCWEAQLDGKAITFVPTVDPTAANRNPDLKPQKPVKRAPRPTLTGILKIEAKKKEALKVFKG